MTTKVPQGYFDATTLLREVKDINLKVKVSQFLDSEEVESIATTLQDYKLVQEGRYGYTYLKLELLPLFNQWLLAVGKGRGKKLPSKVALQLKETK